MLCKYCVICTCYLTLLRTNMLNLSSPQNGSSRSLCAALDCFASLFPYIRPSRCNSYAQGLLPVLVRVTGREEEALHDSLQEAFGKILPTMTPFLSTANLQVRIGPSCLRGPTLRSTDQCMTSISIS